MNAAASTLQSLSIDLARAVADALPAVAYVDAHPRRDASGIAWDDRHLVTVDHAIDREDDIDVLLGNGATTKAALVGRDPATDIAVLRTQATIAPLRRARPDALAIGHLVLALGRDEDGSGAATFGIVSAHDGPWRTWRGGTIERFVRPDTATFAGFSGGALVDTGGALAGMNTWGLSRRNALTIPVETLERVATALIGGGRIARGYLGVALQTVRLPQRLRAIVGNERRTAAIVVDVAPEGPAERAGIGIGDVVYALGSDAVEDSADVERALGSDSVGTRRTLHVVRGGATLAIAVEVSERPRDDE